MNILKLVKVQIAAAAVVFWYSSDVTNVVIKVLDQYDPNATNNPLNEFVDTLQGPDGKSVAL